MSVRQQVIDAALLALNTGRPTGIPATSKWTGVAIEPARLPFSSIVRTRESVRQAGSKWGPLVERRCRFVVEHLVAGVGSPTPLSAEEVAEPLLSWDVVALSGSQLGGLALDTIEIETTWTLEQGEVPFARVQHEFEVVFTTRVNDADQRT